LRNRYLPSYWAFYATRLGREELRRRTVFVKPDEDIGAAPPGSLILGNAADPHVAPLLAAGATRLADVPELDREPFFTVLQR
jgi:hypothetical protein